MTTTYFLVKFSGSIHFSRSIDRSLSRENLTQRQRDKLFFTAIIYISQEKINGIFQAKWTLENTRYHTRARLHTHKDEKILLQTLDLYPRHPTKLQTKSFHINIQKKVDYHLGAIPKTETLLLLSN